MDEESCPFCDVEALKDRVVYRARLGTVLLSDPRLMPGHVLVIPNRHVERPVDLSVKETEEVYRLANLAADRLFELGFDGVDIWQKTRPWVPQGRIKVDHVHVHVLPSTLEDERYHAIHRWSPDQFERLSVSERVLWRTRLL